MPPRSDQVSIPAAWVRGGSSNAVFYHEKDIPAQGPIRDRVLKRVMGTPDPIQIDGLGGAKAVTSKIAIIRPSKREDADIDYIFAQSGVAIDTIDYSANCGNISSGVGPFAIDEGLVRQFRKGRSIDPKFRTQEVRIYNTGTEKVLISHVPIDEDEYSVASGEYTMAAVPGTGAPILMDYRETIGASHNNGVLPTGNPTDRIRLEDGRSIDITIGDVGNTIVFVSAEDMSISSQESAQTLTENKALLDRVREVRGKASLLIGLCKSWQNVDQESPFMPMLSIISPPPANDAEAQMSGRLFLDNMCHESMAGTASVCTAAVSRTKGTLVYDLVGAKGRAKNVLNIAHPLGSIPVALEVEVGTEDTREPKFSTLSFIRTSRRLMDGKVYVPKSVFEGHGETNGVNGHS
jgi:2-methylaconitate cis-trans-isomerase PrpF